MSIIHPWSRIRRESRKGGQTADLTYLWSKRMRQKKSTTKPECETISPERSLPSGDHVALRLWLRLLGCHNQVETYLRNHLRQGFDTTLPRFDLMAQLDRHPEGLRMREVSRLLMVTGGNVTGLTDRLVDEGLIVRKDDPSDRRAYFISLTPKGKAQFAEMALQHEQWIISLFSALDETELHQLSDLLGKMKSHLSTKSIAN